VLEQMLCSLFTIFPDYPYGATSAKCFGKYVTINSVSGVDAVALVHAMILRVRAALLPLQLLVFSAAR
jgi:hypothetical protein